MDAAGLDRVERGETGRQHTGREAKVTGGRIAIGEFDIGWRVNPRGSVRGARRIRIIGEYAVDLDPHLSDVGVAGQQAGEGRAGDRGPRSQNKVVPGLDLDLSAARRARGSRHSSVRIS